MNLIISATNRPNNNSVKVARYYQKKLQEKSVEADLLSLEDLPADLILSDLYGNRSEAFLPIQEKVMQANKFLFVIPEYNGSFPGVFKTFIDACTFPQSFYDKKAALVGVGAGRYGNLRGLEHFTGSANYFHLHIMPLKIYLPNIFTELNDLGEPFQEDTIKFIDEQIEKFIKY